MKLALGLLGIGLLVVPLSESAGLSPYDDVTSGLQKIAASNYVSGQTKKSYRQQNPGEWQKVKAYLDGGSEPTGIQTLMGQGLVEVERGRRQIAPLPPEPPPPPPADAYFVDEFSDPDFAAWLKEPSGAVPSLINLAEGAARLIVTPTSSGPNSNSELTSLFLGNGDARIHTGRGEETWYRVKMRFPSGAYFPTTGEWNWHFEWHTDNHTGTLSTAMGVASDFPVVSGQVGQNPRLWLRLAGGLSSSPVFAAHKLPSNSLRYDHWYDIVFRIVWGTDLDGNGHVAWWVDGEKIVDQSFPMLFRNPDGTVDHPAFGLYNYRLHDPAHSSEVHFDSLVIGPSAASVGFTP